MKNILYISILMIASITSYGQSHTVDVPLSNPGQSGTLEAYSHNGTITVMGYDGNQVVVEVSGQSSDNKMKRKSKNGLKRIASSNINTEITEDNNVVSVNTSHNSKTNLSIKVPRNFNLKIGTHHNGNVLVSDVSGDIEVSAHHGSIEMENISGSALADTHHGEIKATFVTVNNGKPMAFTTYHGDVDVTFPGDVKCDTKIKTSKGDIFTDFEMSVQPQKVESEKSGKKTKIKIGGWMEAKIGSGGEEYMFSTYHGDVIIRKA